MEQFKLKQIFGCFKILQILISDIGTAFTSTTFSNFCALHGIQHIRTRHFHQQSNQQAVCFVDSFKRTFIKNKEERIKQEILSSYRATPNLNTPHFNSPAETLMNHAVLHMNVMHPTPKHSPKKGTW